MNRDSSGRPNIPRLTLGDLTNQLGKRGFPLISQASGAAKAFTKENNFLPGKKISVIGNNSNNFQPGKKISVIGNNSKVGISGAKFPKIANVKQSSLPVLKGGKTYRLLARGNTHSAVDSNRQTRIQLSCAENNLGVLSNGNVSVNEVDRGCVFSKSVCNHDPEIDGKSRDLDSEATQEEHLTETLGSQTASTDECPQFGGSRLAKPFDLEKPISLEAANDNATAATELIKSCSCSFCTKAAHIWSELHYMDAKGRISALVKSKKEATNLVRRFSLGNGIGKGSRSSLSDSYSELEFELMNQTKSLFTSMEQMFGKECSQLETEFSSLKDIRESFKKNLTGHAHPHHHN